MAVIDEVAVVLDLAVVVTFLVVEDFLVELFLVEVALVEVFLVEVFLVDVFLVDIFLGGMSLSKITLSLTVTYFQCIIARFTYQMVPCGSFTHFNVLKLQHVTPVHMN
jgi:hypothetical protein